MTEEAVLLGEPTFVPIEGGRFRCVETGHELLERDKPKYAASKKCRAALFDRALAEGKPPLNYFKQSPNNRDKIICKLTGAIVNKSEKAIWKHVLGKSFTNKLLSEEKKPEGEEQIASDKKQSKKETELEKSDDENDDDLKFWMPPETDSEPDQPIVHEKKKKKKKKKSDDDDKVEVGTEEGKSEEKVRKQKKKKKKSDDDDKVEVGTEDGKSEEKVRKQKKKKKDPAMKPVSKAKGSATKPEFGDELDEDTEQRMKRLALAVGPSSFASRKKKRKTQT